VRIFLRELLQGRRRIGRPKRRWIDGVLEDTVKNWWTVAREKGPEGNRGPH
jgi:hypothetical protein